MTLSSAPCPSCGSADVRRAESGDLRCNVCDALFRVDERGGVQVIEAGRPVAPQGSSRARMAWIGLAVVGLGLALGALWTMRPVLDETTEPSLAVNVAEKKRGVSLKIDAIREGRTKDDHAFWIMTLHNDGARAVRSPAAIIRLYDANNAPAGEVRANAWTDVLEPGEDVVVLGLDDRPVRHSRSEADVVEPIAAPRGATTTALMLRTTSVAKEGDVTVVHGEISNTHDQAMRLSSVQVVGRTREGRPVAFGAGKPAALLLEPGASTTFEVRVDDLRVDVPDAYTAYAVTKPDGVPVPPSDSDLK